MQLLIKKEKYILGRNILLWLSFACICFAALFSAKSYVYDLTYRQDAVGIFDSMVYDSVIWIIFLSVVFSVVVGSNFAYRTIDNEVFAGQSRYAIYFSKFLVYDVVFCSLLLIYPILGMLCMISALGISGNLYVAFSHILLNVLVMFIQYSAILSFVIFIVILCGDILKSTAINGLIALLSGLIVAYGNPAGWFDSIKILKMMPIQQVRDLISKKASITAGPQILSGLVLVITFNLLALVLFKRKALK
ncbi:MAG: hypothetical protein J6I76_08915 [Oribacterium sp.]|nr:hypothetical protein [Oribacterium sp.]